MTRRAPPASDRPAPALRAEALESLLVERGLVDPKVVDDLIRTLRERRRPDERRQGRRQGVDRPRLQGPAARGGHAAIAELGFKGPQGEHIVVVENTAEVHNVVVCTLCSCYPWPVLGLPPAWYKDPAYRVAGGARAAGPARRVGPELDDDVEIQVHDSSSEVRYFVLPERPAGTEDLSEEELAALVTRDAMVGVARCGAGRVSLTATSASSSTSTARRAAPQPTASWCSPSRGRAGRSGSPCRAPRGGAVRVGGSFQTGADPVGRPVGADQPTGSPTRTAVLARGAGAAGRPASTWSRRAPSPPASDGRGPGTTTATTTTTTSDAGASTKTRGRGPWPGGYRCQVRRPAVRDGRRRAGRAGGGDTGPQPTELLLASLASCFALAVGHVAAKRQHRATAVDVTGRRYATRDLGSTPFGLERNGSMPDDPATDVPRLLTRALAVCYASEHARPRPRTRGGPGRRPRPSGTQTPKARSEPEVAPMARYLSSDRRAPSMCRAPARRA